MDGLAPSPRRSDRPMVSQNAGHGNDGRRRGTRGFGMLEPADDGNLSLGRRIGVLVVLAALGGAIILAAGGVGGNKSVTPVVSPSAHPSNGIDGITPPLPSAPTVAPVIKVPNVPLRASRTIKLRVTVPEPGTTMSGLVVHIYRGSTPLATQKVTDVGKMIVPVGPLRRGTNKLTATIGNSGGEGPPSASVTIIVDDQPPKVSVKSPRPNTLMNRSRVTIEGKTEDLLKVTGHNGASHQSVTVVADGSGRFTLPDMRLSPGRNVISVRSTDAAGNVGSTSVVIVRGDGHLAANVELSRKTFRVKGLPSTMNVHVTVLAPNGRPVEGATVSFTVAPPSQLTQTYSTTTSSDGTASWSRIKLTPSGATPGPGLVTVDVGTPDGGRTTSTVKFQYR
jgi:hypothetical protein